MESMNIILPKEVANMQLPDPELRNFYVDLEHRTFWLDEEVTPYLLELIKYIVRWNAEDSATPVDKRQPIHIYFFKISIKYWHYFIKLNCFKFINKFF